MDGTTKCLTLLRIRAQGNYNVALSFFHPHLSYRCFSPTNCIRIPIIIHLESRRGGGGEECVAHVVRTTNSKELECTMHNVAKNHYVDIHLNYCIQTDEVIK